MAIGGAIRSGYGRGWGQGLLSHGEVQEWACYSFRLALVFAWRSQVFMPGGQSF